MLYPRFLGLSLSCLMCSATLLSLSTAQAADYYVAKKKSQDKYSCAQAQSISTPKKTINSALACLGPGDTLYVQPGTYQEWILNPPGGTNGNLTRIVAYDGGEVSSPGAVTIKPKKHSENAFRFASQDSSYVLVKGFVIDAKQVNSDGIKITDGSMVGQSTNIRIESTEVKRAPMNGILVTGGEGHELVDLDVHDNGTDRLTHGIYLTASNSLIGDCRIHDNTGYGVHLYSGDFNVHDNIVSNNDVWSNGISPFTAGILLAMGERNIAINNTVHENQIGIQVQFAEDSEVFDNTISNNTSCIVVEATATGTILGGNTCINNTND